MACSAGMDKVVRDGGGGGGGNDASGPAPFAWERRVGEQEKPAVGHEVAAAAAALSPWPSSYTSVTVSTWI
jgi:hypothetical protein